MSSAFANNYYADNRFVLGALGDSISTAFNASQLLDNPEQSWATGTSVNSHWQRLRERFAKAQPEVRVVAYNEAKAGARANALSGQIDRLLPRKPHYVTLLIGGNDVLRWPNDASAAVDAFQGTIESGLQRLVAELPRVKVLLVSIPDLHRLYELGIANGYGPIWDLASAYMPHVGEAKRLAHEKREVFVRRWQEANNRLQAAASKFPRNVRFDTSTATAMFGSEHLSRIDHFHPSTAGQNLLAELTWQSSWFAEKGSSQAETLASRLEVAPKSATSAGS